jgi:hypothetical protein
MGRDPHIRKPNGSLTPANGSPNGSNFCKCLERRKVDGLTGKTTPGGHTCHAINALLPPSII